MSEKITPKFTAVTPAALASMAAGVYEPEKSYLLSLGDETLALNLLTGAWSTYTFRPGVWLALRAPGDAGRLLFGDSSIGRVWEYGSGNRDAADTFSSSKDRDWETK